MNPIASHFTLLYFATASSYTSRDSELLPAPLLLSSLFPMLEKRYPGITSKVLETCMVTINLEYVTIPEPGSVDKDIIIKEGDEVAIIPPVGAG